MLLKPKFTLCNICVIVNKQVKFKAKHAGKNSADDIFIYFSQKIDVEISCELSPEQIVRTI